MPRISLYKPEKGKDYEFFDRQISEMFQVGGTDVYLHKYLGTSNPSEADATADQPMYDNVSETNIQDLLFLENRDRKYAPDIFQIRGVYNVQDLDFNLSQFALFIDNDTVFMTVHINDFVKSVGRKPLSGDVIELPHLRDEFAFNDADISLPRYYTISDVGRAAEGFSPTWYPHLYRLKLTKISAQQQFDDILNVPVNKEFYRGDFVTGATYYAGQIVRYNSTLYVVKDDGTVGPEGTTVAPPNETIWDLYTGPILKDVVSSKETIFNINDALLAQAEANTPNSGYDTSFFYTLSVDEEGKPRLMNTDTTELDASSDVVDEVDASRIIEDAIRTGYTGYLVGDGIPTNGATFGHGISFPMNPIDGDYFLRTDFMPNRLFMFDGTRWIRKEDAVRTDVTNTDTRNTQKFTFINNTNTDEINGEVVNERQSLSKALKPKADL